MSHDNVEGFRLSPQQRYLWSLEQGSASHTYQVVSAITITGDVRAGELERALGDVVSRHEILRTTFQRPAGIKIPFQVIAYDPQFSWQYTDLTNLPEETALDKVNQFWLNQLDQAFDLTSGPLLRASLYKLSPEQHVLLLSLPAVCGDSVSISSLVHELAGAACEPMQYADFAEWHNELFETAGEQAERGRRYWQESVSGDGSSLILPLEKRTRSKQTFQFESVSIDLDSTCVANLEAIAQEYETAIPVVLFAFWQALVWRLTNQTDFVIFSLYDGRTAEDLKGALGPYAKYLPVSCRCSDVSLAAHLQATRVAVTKAAQWQDYFDPSSFSEAAKDAVAFDYTDGVVTNAAAGLQFSLTKQELFLSPFKLRLSCFRAPESIRVQLFYDSGSFERETITRYAGYFTKLLKQARPATTIGSIDILGEDERQGLLIGINQTAFELSTTKSIHDLFAEQAERTPDATALVCGDQEITYSELNRRANRLAYLLQQRGLAPNMRVGICIERSAETIIAMLGILKAGGAYVPLNPEHPSARLVLQLAESNAAVLITNGAASAELLEYGGEIIDLERDRASLLAAPDTNPTSVSLPADLAYVIYTSGSTGVPKGVAVSQQGLVNYTQFILRRLQVTERLHFATVSTITADLGNTCIFPALVSGGCLHLIDYDVAMEGTLFSEYLAKRPIDVLKIVPSHFSALFAAAGQSNILPAEFLIFGGEALSWELVERVAQAESSCQIINHYGPTETTVGSLTYDVKAHDLPTYSATVPIGQPIANTHVYILDQQLNVTPTGVPGELYIGGAGLAAGYLNQPVETAGRFVPDRFSDQPGKRLYRTGDLARYLPDGNIEFLGRMDHQVKVRGYRVELGEIESVLLMLSEIRQALVIAETGTTENQRLVAYLVANDTKRPSIDELRSFLSQRLPEYMFPSVFVFLKTMPLTANGKIDRAALPAPDESRRDLQRAFVAPRTRVEQELAGIWSTFLKLTQVGIHDNFFELGGHSLLATQVISRMRKTFNYDVPLRSLFESPTIAQLAAQIEGSTASDTERLLAEIEKLSDGEVETILKAEQS